MLKRPRFLTILFAVLCTLSASVAARAAHSDTSTCKSLAMPGWAASERWAWQRICEGEPADFAEAPANVRYGSVRGSFLVTILANARFSNGLPFKQIVFSNAKVQGPTDLSDATLVRGVRFDNVEFDSSLNFDRVTTAYPISVNDTAIGGGLTLSEAHGTSLYLMNVSSPAGVDAHDLVLSGDMRAVLLNNPSLDLERAHVDGYVDVEGSLSEIEARDAQFGNFIIQHALIWGSTLAQTSQFQSAHLKWLSQTTDQKARDAEIDRWPLLKNDEVRAPSDHEASHTSALSDSDTCYGSRPAALDGDHGTFRSVLLTHVAVNGFSVNRSTIHGDVDIHHGHIDFSCMRDLIVHGVFELAFSTVSQQVDLSSATIERNAYFKNSSIPVLNIAEVAFDGSLALSEIHSVALVATDAHVGRGLAVNDLAASVGNATGLNVGGRLTIDQTDQSKTLIDVIDLSGMTVGDALLLSNLRFNSATLSDARLESSATIQHVQVHDGLKLNATDIDGDLHLSDIDAKNLDLSGTRVARTLFFTSTTTKPVGNLSLRDANVQTLEDRAELSCKSLDNAVSGCHDPWPSHQMELEGFHFAQLGSLDENSDFSPANRPVDWWTDWLARPSRYVPQTYDTLANSMQEAGYDENAQKIGEARRDRDRASSPQPKWLMMLLWKYADGYGYGIYYAVLWALFFIALGALVMWLSGEGKRLGMPIGVTYSFDMLVPLVFLEKGHESVRLNGWARYYFYVHKIVGYVLATFLVAGLSVLAK